MRIIRHFLYLPVGDLTSELTDIYLLLMDLYFLDFFGITFCTELSYKEQVISKKYLMRALKDSQANNGER